ncbi:tRNA (guanosine(46)-N7)-methyltransferase TrmB [Streptomyces sp. NPDC092296]|uniref:tRNA (guanosine(46)-N7)-methyltransferase TrmB n=1 Tax=Streptomyces sp. NPDC092296 TaxID=3366012 RepID=UPI0037F37AD7
MTASTTSRTDAARPYPHAATPEQHREQRIRSFHPRRGRLSGTQGDALERLWPRYGTAVDGAPLDLAELFGRSGLPVVLEIGFGMGETTAAMAAADPVTGILAVDVHTPGHAGLLSRIERDGLANVRLAAGDAVVLLRDMVAPGTLAGLRVFFPDPWPKSRHHKRRLIQPEFIALAVSRLAPGATVHCATDWEPYAEQMLAVLSGSPELVNLHPEGDGTVLADGSRPGYAPRPAWRPVTKFERQGLAKGHVVHDLLFRRR